MKKNNGLIIGITLFVVIFVIFILFISSTNKKDDNTDIKIYKLYEKENNKEEHVYRECALNDKDINDLIKEFNRSYNLSDEKIVTGKQITGSYKVIYKDKFIAFDNEKDNIIYIGEKNTLYEFDSNIYKTIINSCN